MAWRCWGSVARVDPRYAARCKCGLALLTLPGPQSPPPGFVYEPPVWEYPHDIGPFAGSAVIGGLVVRTTNYPDLVGTYICIDHLIGRLWSIARGPHETNIARIAGRAGIVQIGIDPSNGDVLLVNRNYGIIERQILAQMLRRFHKSCRILGCLPI
jgi:hypothetical protein